MEIPIGSSLILFFQFFGGALFLAFGQTTFLNRLRPALHSLAPEANATQIINVGAGSVRLVVAKSSLKAVLTAFNRALTQTFVSDTTCQL
jgi:type II secretory pathway component GspD/PulD (secretin)